MNRSEPAPRQRPLRRPQPAPLRVRHDHAQTLATAHRRPAPAPRPHRAQRRRQPPTRRGHYRQRGDPLALARSRGDKLTAHREVQLSFDTGARRINAVAPGKRQPRPSGTQRPRCCVRWRTGAITAPLGRPATCDRPSQPPRSQPTARPRSQRRPGPECAHSARRSPCRRSST
jgi:hypothetical protein